MQWRMVKTHAMCCPYAAPPTNTNLYPAQLTRMMRKNSSCGIEDVVNSKAEVSTALVMSCCTKRADTPGRAGASVQPPCCLIQTPKIRAPPHLVDLAVAVAVRLCGARRAGRDF